MRLPPRFLPVLILLAAASPASAQMSAADIAMRLDALENQIRQLTGQIEQLQYRNQQLELQLRRTTEDNEYRFQELSGKGGQRPPQAQRPAGPPATPSSPPPGRRGDLEPQSDPRYANPDPRSAASDPRAAPDPRSVTPDPRIAAPDPRTMQRDNPNFVSAPNSGGRRGDAFDPNANPTAPGAPRPLGALPPGQPSAPPVADEDDDSTGVRSGREPGAPLDLSTLANNATSDPNLQRRGGSSPSARHPGGTVASVAPQAESPREQFDLGYGHILRKDYAAAEHSFRDFLQRFPNDRLTPDANYWLGESLFQRQRYQDAAEIYLVVTTKYENANRAPDSLLRLGQSLAAIGQREMACASFAEVGRKYPRASASVKQSVEREQKRVRC